MKKLTAAAVGAALFMCVSASAGAAGRMAAVTDKIADDSEIHILYNDSIVQYEDVKPVNTDGRVMIPFRAALENMGATVDYDDANRLVTAKKGDITISFTLMDDTIYIDKNGVSSTITMDVPMIIVEDRTLVPIRFMSNALDMQVGWDGETETVIIMDYDDYFVDLPDVMPNMTKLLQLKVPTYTKKETVFDASVSYDAALAKLNAGISGTASGSQGEGNADIKLSVNTGVVNIDGENVKAVYKDGIIYINNEAVSKLAAEKTGQPASEWCSIDINKFIDSMDVFGVDKAVFRQIMLGGTDAEDFKDAVMSNVSLDGGADIDTALKVAMQFDIYEEIDKFVSVTEGENGTYRAEIKMSNDDFINLISSMVGELTPEEVRELKDTMSLDVSSVSEFNADSIKTETYLKTSVNMDGAKTDITVNVTLTGSNENGASAQIPASSVDITNLLIG